MWKDEFEFIMPIEGVFIHGGMSKRFIDPVTVGLLMGGGALGGALLGGGGKKSKPKYSPWQIAAGNWEKNLLESGVPNIPRMQIPGLTDYEQQSQSILGRYLGSEMPVGYGNMVDVLGGIAMNPEDIVNSPEYKGYTGASREEEARTANALRRGGQLAGGTSRSGPNIGQEINLRRGFANDRLSRLGSIMNASKDRQMSAIGPYLSALDYMNREPMQKVQAGMQYGGIERMLEGMQNEADYNALMTEVMFPYNQQLGVAQSMSGIQPSYMTQPQPSTFSNAMSGMSLMAMLMGMGGFGGGGGGGGINTVPSSGGNAWISNLIRGGR